MACKKVHVAKRHLDWNPCRIPCNYADQLEYPPEPVRSLPSIEELPFKLGGSDTDVDHWLSQLQAGCRLSEEHVKELCRRAEEVLIREPNIRQVDAPITVCGDLMGQFYDLMELFKCSGFCPDNDYLFMGNYINRGPHSLEVLQYLLTLKVRYPHRITLLRGNHESKDMTKAYGFYDECMTKYPTIDVWKCLTDLFEIFPLTAMIDSSYFVVHGGLSPHIIMLDQLRDMPQRQEAIVGSPVIDLLWSDPTDECVGWDISPRGIGHLFGADITEDFNFVNHTVHLYRSHQLVPGGFLECHHGLVTTVFSAPNYCGRTQNIAACMKMNERHGTKFLQFYTGSTKPNRKGTFAESDVSSEEENEGDSKQYGVKLIEDDTEDTADEDGEEVTEED